MSGGATGDVRSSLISRTKRSKPAGAHISSILAGANHLEAVEQILVSHRLAPPSALTMQLYWTLYLGVFAHWATDDSPKQEDSMALLDQSLKLFTGALQSAGRKAGHHENKSK